MRGVVGRDVLGIPVHDRIVDDRGALRRRAEPLHGRHDRGTCRLHYGVDVRVQRDKGAAIIEGAVSHGFSGSKEAVHRI